jgi:7-cyano-7-deazaguanine reductase
MNLTPDEAYRFDFLKRKGILDDLEIREYNILKEKEKFIEEETENDHPKPIKDDTSKLTMLGSKETKYIYDSPSSEMLETFPNQYPDRSYVTQFIFDEFTSLCPKTGQPDFAKITVEYIPDQLCIETKSLKVYFLAYRQERTFMETLTNRILEDCIKVCSPRQLRVTSNFNARGGTFINVIADYQKP